MTNKIPKFLPLKILYNSALARNYMVRYYTALILNNESVFSIIRMERSVTHWKVSYWLKMRQESEGIVS